MKRTLIRLAACLFVVAMVASAGPAEVEARPDGGAVVESVERPAHYPNPYANWACGGTRPSAHYNLAIHFHPEGFVYDQNGDPVLVVSCESQYPQLCRGATWAAYLLADGTPYGPLNGYHFYPC